MKSDCRVTPAWRHHGTLWAKSKHQGDPGARGICDGASPEAGLPDMTGLSESVLVGGGGRGGRGHPEEFNHLWGKKFSMRMCLPPEKENCE